MCQDPSVTYLNSIGYNVVRFPEEGIDPLILLSRGNGQLEALGPLPSLFQDVPPPPQPKVVATPTELDGKKTSEFKIDLGLGILTRILSALGVIVDLKIAYRQARSMVFVYKNVSALRVFPVDISSYLAVAKLAQAGPIFDGLQEDGKSFIITETLRSNTFETIAYSESGATVDISVPDVTTALTGGTATKPGSVVTAAKNTDTLGITYVGSTSLPFAFKAFALYFQIVHGQIQWKFHPAGSIGPLAMESSVALPTPDEATPILFGRDTLVRLKQSK